MAGTLTVGSAVVMLHMAVSACDAGEEPRGGNGDTGGSEAGAPDSGGSGGADATGGTESGGGAPGAGGGEPAALTDVDAVVIATRQTIPTAFDGDYEDRVPNDPSADESTTYTNACTGGGSVQVDYEKFDTETDVDIVFLWLTLTNCVENGITMNGELYGETVGGASVANELVIFGTPEYSTVGPCEWDMTGTGWDGLRLELSGGTICGVAATSLGPYPEIPL